MIQLMQHPLNRRNFIKRAGVAGVGLSLTSFARPLFAQGQSSPSINTLGANAKLRVAVIGTNGRGLAHVECLTDGLPNVTVAAICDVDDRAIAKGIKQSLKR